MEEITAIKPKRNLNKKLLCLFSLAFLILFLGINDEAAAASLYFSPSSGSYYQSENLTVSIKVETVVAINALEGAFSFPTRYLEVIRLSKSNSIVNLWIREPSFSNAGDFGNVSFEGVILNPGFTGSAGKIIDVVFRAKNKGLAELDFLKTSILANDGLGTNVTAPNGKANFITLTPKIETGETAGEGGAQTPVVIVKGLSPELPKEIKSLIAIWDNLPQWFKVGVLIMAGVALLIPSFILLSFGIIILIYLWKYAFSKKERAAKRLRLFSKLPRHIWRALKKATRKLLVWLKLAEREFEGDVKYGIEQLETDFEEVTSPPPPLTKIVKDYWLSIIRITKRFFTRNITPTGSDKPDEKKK